MIKFYHREFELAVREAAGIFDRPIEESDLSLVERLYCDNFSFRSEDLAVLQRCRALKELSIVTKGEESPFLSEIGPLVKLDWDDYAPLKTDATSIKLEVCNQKGYGSSPTHSIRELLKVNQYSWDRQKRVWYRFYPKESFTIGEILDQSWVMQASHVVLCQYDEDSQLQDAYLIGEEDITQLRTGQGDSTQ